MRSMSSSRSRTGSVDLPRMWLANTTQRRMRSGWFASVQMTLGEPAPWASRRRAISSGHSAGGIGSMRGWLRRMPVAMGGPSWSILGRTTKDPRARKIGDGAGVREVASGPWLRMPNRGPGSSARCPPAKR